MNDEGVESCTRGAVTLDYMDVEVGFVETSTLLSSLSFLFFSMQHNFVVPVQVLNSSHGVGPLRPLSSMRTVCFIFGPKAALFRVWALVKHQQKGGVPLFGNFVEKQRKSAKLCNWDECSLSV